MTRIILSPVLPSAMYNFHLQIKPSVKDTYARWTTVSRIGFWYYYDSSETLLHERASVITGLDYWTGLLDWTILDSNFNALKTFLCSLSTCEVASYTLTTCKDSHFTAKRYVP